MTLPERATNMPSASLPGVDPAADFVINSGRYFHGTTGRPYQPVVKVADPLPAAAYLYWGLRAQGASGEYDRLLCALQRHTGVGVNAFSIKNSGGQLGFELRIGQRLPAGGQQRLDRLLGTVDRRATRLLLFRCEPCQLLHEFGEAPGLAQELGLGVLQVGRGGAGREGGLRAFDQGIQFVHEFSQTKKG